MGTMLVKRIMSTEGITVAAAFDLVRVGEDIGDVAGIGKIGVPVSDAKDLEKVLKEAKVDVYIDFTIAKATVVNAPIAARCGVNLIIGTTGLTAEDKTMITSEVVKNNVAAVISSNYSIGVATFMKLCKQAAPEIFRGAGPGCVSEKCPEKIACGSPRQKGEWDA
jgi:4-hydroxy-tetrahydrodipicolinate reductase